MSPVAVAAASLVGVLLDPHDAFLLAGTDPFPDGAFAADPLVGTEPVLGLELEPLLPQPGRTTARAEAPIAMGTVRRVQLVSCITRGLLDPPEWRLNGPFRNCSGS